MYSLQYLWYQALGYSSSYVSPPLFFFSFSLGHLEVYLKGQHYILYFPEL